VTRVRSNSEIQPALTALLEDGTATGLSDRELLERFASSRDQSGEFAFATLVARHGPMVKGVCRRMLRNPADADDAFQATFLVLVRRAGSIRLGDSLGPWLYGVTVRVARRARAVGARRQLIELAAEAADPCSERRPQVNRDLGLIIDEELSRLPESFRTAIVLCHLQGFTHDEAADRLGCPVGTIRSRLARGRALLRRRLEHTGLATFAGSCAWPALDEPRSIVTRDLITHIARIAARYAAGQPLRAVVPAAIAKLASGVTMAMTITKSAAICSLLLLAALVAGGFSRLGAQTQGGKPTTNSKTAIPTDSNASRVALQGSSDVARKSKASLADANTRLDPALLADLPPVVLEVVPPLGSANVDPGLREIRVTFSKKMTDRSWSLIEGTKYAVPKVRGEIHYEKDHRTLVIPVQLEPGKTYLWGVNSERFRNFQDTDGRPALPYLIVFRTRSAR
jgi:RNA polymerase sigma factor (sigma-70 family)